MAVLLLTDRSFQRYRLLGDLKDLTYTVYRHVHLLSDLFRRRFTSKLLKQLTGNTDQLVDRLNHMHRDTDGTCLVRNGSCDGLTDPPGCIGTELVALSVIKFLNCLDKTKVTFLDQIKEQHSTSHITLGDADNKTEVRFCQTLLGSFITFFHSFCKLDLLVCTQQADFTDFFQVHTDRILDADTFRHGEVDLVKFYLFFIIQAFHIHIVIKEEFVTAVVCDTENVHTAGLQEVKDFLHLIYFQWRVLEEVADLLIFQHILFLFRKFKKLYKFLAEFCHIHFHRCSIPPYSVYILSLIERNMQLLPLSSKVFQFFFCFYQFLKPCHV